MLSNMTMQEFLNVSREELENREWLCLVSHHQYDYINDDYNNESDIDATSIDSFVTIDDDMLGYGHLKPENYQTFIQQLQSCSTLKKISLLGQWDNETLLFLYQAFLSVTDLQILQLHNMCNAFLDDDNVLLVEAFFNLLGKNSLSTFEIDYESLTNLDKSDDCKIIKLLLANIKNAKLRVVFDENNVGHGSPFYSLIIKLFSETASELEKELPLELSQTDRMLALCLEHYLPKNQAGIGLHKDLKGLTFKFLYQPPKFFSKVGVFEYSASTQSQSFFSRAGYGNVSLLLATDPLPSHQSNETIDTVNATKDDRTIGCRCKP